jgi:hypothetical protein
VEALALPHVSDTIRRMLAALEREGIVECKTVERTHRWNHPAGELVHTRLTRVYSLVKDGRRQG